MSDSLVSFEQHNDQTDNNSNPIPVNLPVNLANLPPVNHHLAAAVEHLPQELHANDYVTALQHHHAEHVPTDVEPNHVDLGSPVGVGLGVGLSHHHHHHVVGLEHVQPEPVGLALPPPPKRQRRRYDNNFKSQVLEHLKIPGSKIPNIAKQYGIPENTVREWTKVSVVQSIETARAKHGGSLKANMYEPMRRLAEALMVFFEKNERDPPHLKQPVTTKLVVAKALESRNNLLELHDIQPFLDPKEKKALENFTGSDSWAKKFAKRHDLKMSGARVKDLAEDDVRTYSVQLRQMASRIKQAGPGYEEVSSLLRQAAEKMVAVRMVSTRRTNGQHHTRL